MTVTYKEALAESRREGVSKCGDAALMASFLDGCAQTLLGAVSPRLVWDGAQKRGLSSKGLMEMIHDDPAAAVDLMWEA